LTANGHQTDTDTCNDVQSGFVNDFLGAMASIDRSVLRIIGVLSLTQVIGWGTVVLPAIVGRQMAAELGMELPAIFAGTSVLYVVMGLCSPLLGKLFVARGARVAMIAGTLISVPGFLCLAMSQGPVGYFVAWGMLGLGGSASLTTAAYVLLSEVAGTKAKPAIGTLMLITGLSSSVFWPITELLSRTWGWRGTCVTYAVLLLVVSLPLYIFCLPSHRKYEAPPSTRAGAPEAIASRSTFLLIVAAIALNSFVTYGFAAVMIELLQATGLPLAQAIAFGSALGVIQVGARAMDVLGGKWDGIATGVLAGIALPVSMAILLFGSGAFWSVAAFLLLYGLGSGALAVARATIPLVFYQQAAYAKAVSRIALPLNLMSALAPPLLIAALGRQGVGTLLAVAIACSSTALVMLLMLARRRPRSVAAVASP